jgi:hypothetical protein
MPVKITPAGGYAFRMKNQAANLGRVALDLIKTHQVNASANCRRKRIEDRYGGI